MLINAPYYLNTPTYDGSGQAVHPSLIDFYSEFGILTWGGFRYWMAMTPYPNGDDAYENPSLLVSQDGIKWIVPPELQWPIDIKPGTKNSNPANYNSDPELIFDCDENCLLLYWRESLVGISDLIWRTRIDETIPYLIMRKTLCIAVPFKSQFLLMSPTVWRKSLTKWSIWTCNGDEIYYRSSLNGVHWEEPRRCNLSFCNFNQRGIKPWHLSAKPNYFTHKVEFLICGSFPEKQRPMYLWYAEASFENLLDIQSPFHDFLLKPSQDPLGWDNEMIYRSTFTREMVKCYTFYRVWYSARSKIGNWHIGFTNGFIN